MFEVFKLYTVLMDRPDNPSFPSPAAASWRGTIARSPTPRSRAASTSWRSAARTRAHALALCGLAPPAYDGLGSFSHPLNGAWLLAAFFIFPVTGASLFPTHPARPCAADMGATPRKIGVAESAGNAETPPGSTAKHEIPVAEIAGIAGIRIELHPLWLLPEISAMVAPTRGAPLA